MNTLLVNGLSFKPRRKLLPIPPIGIALLISYLRHQGYQATADDLDVKVVHDNLSSVSHKKIPLPGVLNINRINEYLKGKINDDYLDLISDRLVHKLTLEGRDLVGISLTRGMFYENMLVAKKIHESKGIPIVLGGTSISPNDYQGQFTGCHGYVLQQYPFVDYLVNGSGEIPLSLLIEQLENGNDNHSNVPGLVYRSDEGVVSNTNTTTDMSADLLPDFSSLPIELYKYTRKRIISNSGISHIKAEMMGLPADDGKPMLILPYKFQRGCPFHCAFCRDSTGTDFAIKPVDQVIEEINVLKKEFRTKYFLFLNSEINTNLQYMQRLVSQMKERDLDIIWSDSARLEHLDSGTLQSLYGVGCRCLWFGAEMPSQRMIDFIGKNIDLREAEKIIRCSDAAGITNGLNFIVGMPSESESDFLDAKGFIDGIRESFELCSVNQLYVAGLFLKNPERFGIRLRNETVDLMYGMHGVRSLAFDEIQGLSWEAKHEVTATRWKDLVNFTQDKLSSPLGSPHLLFTLYDIFDDKIDIKKMVMPS